MIRTSCFLFVKVEKKNANGTSKKHKCPKRSPFILNEMRWNATIEETVSLI